MFDMHDDDPGVVPKAARCPIGQADANGGTDGAGWRAVLLAARYCAASWEPGVRILGNVTAGDLARAIDEALAHGSDRQPHPEA